ncbi:hypothetical protein GEMRC1_002361 [Eukaryota sp. GEM-RC1]
MVLTQLLWSIFVVLAFCQTDKPSDLQFAWTKDTNVPVLSPSSILKTDTSAYSIFVSSITESFFSVDLSSGRDNPGFPLSVYTSIYSSPIFKDVDGDGVLDYLVPTESGHLLYVDSTGHPLTSFMSRVAPIPVKMEWFSPISKPSDKDKPSNDKYDPDVEPDSTIPTETSPKSKKSHHSFDPKTLPPEGLSSLDLLQIKQAPGPRLSFQQQNQLVHRCDLSNPNSPILLRLLPSSLPLSHSFFDSDFFEHNPFSAPIDVTKYVSSGLARFELGKNRAPLQSWLPNKPHTSSSSPFSLISKVTAPSPSLTILSDGWVYLLDAETGETVPGFPVKLDDTVTSQVALVDVDGDDVTEIIIVDSSGSVYCLSGTGKIVWKVALTAHLFRASPIVSRVAVDNEETDVIFIGGSSKVFALRARDGSMIDALSYSLDTVITTPLTPIMTSDGPGVVFCTEDGNLRVLNPRTKDISSIELEERVLTPALVVADKKVFKTQKIVVVSISGKIICLDYTPMGRNSFLTESYNGRRDPTFVNSIKILTKKEVSGRFTKVRYMIRDYRNVTKSSVENSNRYCLSFHFGDDLVSRKCHSKPGIYSKTVKLPGIIGKLHLTVTMSLSDGLITSDTTVLRANTFVLDDLKYFALLPVLFLIGGVLLLKVSGFGQLPI